MDDESGESMEPMEEVFAGSGMKSGRSYKPEAASCAGPSATADTRWASIGYVGDTLCVGIATASRVIITWCQVLAAWRPLAPRARTTISLHRADRFRRRKFIDQIANRCQ